MSSTNSIEYVRCMKCGKILKYSPHDSYDLLQHINNDHPEIDIINTDTKLKRQFHNRPANETTESSIKQEPTADGHQSNAGGGIKNCNPSEKASNGEGKRPKLKPRWQVKDIDLSRYSATSEILAKYPEIKECEYAPRNPNTQVAYTRRYKLTTPSPESARLLQQPFQYTLYRTSIEKWCPASGSIYCPKCGNNKPPVIKTKAERYTRNDCGACCLLSCWPFCFVPWLCPAQNQEYLYCAACKTFLGLYDRQRNCLKPNRLYISSGNSDLKQPSQPTKLNWNHVKREKLLENDSPPPKVATTGSGKSPRLSSVTVNGKELSPDAVARIEKYKRFGSLVGVDLDNLTDDANSSNHYGANRETAKAAPSAAKSN